MSAFFWWMSPSQPLDQTHRHPVGSALGSAVNCQLGQSRPAGNQTALVKSLLHCLPNAALTAGTCCKLGPKLLALPVTVPIGLIVWRSLPSSSASFSQALLPSASCPMRFCSMNDRANFCASGKGKLTRTDSSTFASPDGVKSFGFQLYFWRRQYSMCLRLLGLN